MLVMTMKMPPFLETVVMALFYSPQGARVWSSIEIVDSFFLWLVRCRSSAELEFENGRVDLPRRLVVMVERRGSCLKTNERQ